jgi:hypothetical protein
MPNFRESPQNFPVPKYSRVLVCGGRDYENWQLVFDVLERIAPKFIVTGGQGKERKNRGADHHAESYAKTYIVPHAVVHADWDAFGRSAGPRRNSEMLILHPTTEWVVAFPGGRGTADMLKKARAAKIPSIVFDYKGDYEVEYPNAD